MNRATYHVADLFCGAGGTSSGLMQAAEELGRRVELTAVNHWDTAVETHSKNHPAANHYCASLDSLDPRKAVLGGKLDLLWASPECIHHSRARGGKPMNDQSRATAWCVIRWADALDIDTIMIENVVEFQEWGPTYPLDHPEEKLRGRPVVAEKGKYFRNFVRNLRCLGYTVEWRELVCANFGDATTRRRFFLMAKKGRRRLHWPAASHCQPMTDTLDLDLGLKPWRAARQIIDWSLAGKSIFGRKKPLKENTIRRILAGLEKFNGLQFVLPMNRDDASRSVDMPLRTITATSADMALTQPLLVVFRNNCDGRPLTLPLPAVCTSPGHFGLLQPYLVRYNGGAVGTRGGDRRTESLDLPLSTIDTSNRFGLAQPFMIGAGGTSGQQRPQSLEEPMGAILANDRRAVIQPFLVKYNGTGLAESVNDPMDTIPTRDRFGLAEPAWLEDGVELRLDILFRMLQPHELAAAHSFPDGYRFAGNRDDVVRQIGNSVPVRTARALGCAALRWAQ